MSQLKKGALLSYANIFLTNIIGLILTPFIIRILGDEYQDKNYTGRTYCEQKGIELYFNSRDHRFSSSGLRKIVAEKEVQKVNE